MLARIGYRCCRDTGLLRNMSEQPRYEADSIITYFLYKRHTEVLVLRIIVLLFVCIKGKYKEDISLQNLNRFFKNKENPCFVLLRITGFSVRFQEGTSKKKKKKDMAPVLKISKYTWRNNSKPQIKQLENDKYMKRLILFGTRY